MKPNIFSHGNTTSNIGIAGPMKLLRFVLMAILFNLFHLESQAGHIPFKKVNLNRSFIDPISCTIMAIPSNNIFTGGIPTHIYLGYGPQSVTLKVLPLGGSSFSYSWNGGTLLNCNNCQSPVFAPTFTGSYNFTVTVTNELNQSATCTIKVCVLDIRVPGSNDKVYITHFPDQDPAHFKILELSPNAVPGHFPYHSLDRLGQPGQVPCRRGNAADYLSFNTFELPLIVIR